MADKFQYIYSDPTDSTNACLTGTPYGTFNTDATFCNESVNVCKFVAKRLGHPVMQLEFNSGSIYAMFEEAVSEYSQQIHHYNMKNWLWDQYGNEDKIESGSVGTGEFQPQHSTMGSSIILSDTYGQNAGVGGDVELHSGSITLKADEQDYDLNAWSRESGSHDFSSFDTGSNKVVVQRVFNQMPAAITRFYDPYTGTYDQRMMLDQFGFSSYSPATTFVMRPINYDIMRAQAIETSDYVRKSNYSFEIVNNRLKVFPRPTSTDEDSKIWFEYYVRSDLKSTTRDYTNNKVSDPSNAPYKFITYSQINAPGRQWIRKYTLALAKELLGIIRSKYGSMPIPDGEVSLDGDALKAEGREEKALLLEELKEFLESVTLRERATAEQEQANANQEVLNKSPLGIYLG